MLPGSILAVDLGRKGAGMTVWIAVGERPEEGGCSNRGARCFKSLLDLANELPLSLLAVVRGRE